MSSTEHNDFIDLLGFDPMALTLHYDPVDDSVAADDSNVISLYEQYPTDANIYLYAPTTLLNPTETALKLPFSSMSSNLGNADNVEMLGTTRVDDPLFTIPIAYPQLALQNFSSYTYNENLIQSEVYDTAGESVEYSLNKVPYNYSQRLEILHKDQVQPPISSFLTALDDTGIRLLNSAYPVALQSINPTHGFQLQTDSNPPHMLPHRGQLLPNIQPKHKLPTDIEHNDHEKILEKKKRYHPKFHLDLLSRRRIDLQKRTSGNNRHGRSGNLRCGQCRRRNSKYG